MPWRSRILIIGAGDTGTVSAIRLFKSGFRPIMLELSHPSDLHYNRNFSDVVYQSKKIIDEVETVKIYPDQDDQEIEKVITTTCANRQVPLISYDDPTIISKIQPEIIIDCAGKYPEPLKLDWEDYSLVIRVGLKYNVGLDGHVVVGDCGDQLGRVVRKPHDFKHPSRNDSECITAPIEGIFISNRKFGEAIQERDEIGTINDISILSPTDGYLTGLLHSGHFVSSRQPLFEITVSYKMKENYMFLPVQKLAIAGGILEAVLAYLYEKH
jgi:xanthine dehydrogenase accessory factor